MIPKVFVGDCNVGKGVFAARPFSPGDLILTFQGHRVEREDPIHFELLGANLIQTGRSTYIMPIEPGVFVNHSCDPNAGVSRNRRLIALKAIRLGEEIRFDYSTTMDEALWTMECCCGDPGCRSRVKDFGELPPEVQARYLSGQVVQGFIARKYRRV